ncbi:hypothetical protein SLEP1_g22744 [Rubroshorea leprosula]|uniref:Transmembrane protein n=1 Tax=Rubroshorea leprosula TaxID=152421 RepID=A0AAV5JD45_9ROSI|nr:hypothetical protein SLEP1_g22744 [Rubroshorea leprosula]
MADLFLLFLFLSSAACFSFFSSPLQPAKPPSPTAPLLGKNRNFRSAAAFSFLLLPVAAVGGGFGFLFVSPLHCRRPSPNCSFGFCC